MQELEGADVRPIGSGRIHDVEQWPRSSSEVSNGSSSQRGFLVGVMIEVMMLLLTSADRNPEAGNPGR